MAPPRVAFKAKSAAAAAAAAAIDRPAPPFPPHRLAVRINEDDYEDRDEILVEEEEEEEGVEQGDGGEEAKGEEEKGARAKAGSMRVKRKQREYEVFIGGLDRDTTESDLVRVFRDAGEVVEVRLVLRPHLPGAKGFAFVRFATVEQARKAATELRYVQVRGKSCGVSRSNDNETLHVGNICTSWTKDDLVEKLNEFELENLEEVHLMVDPLNERKNRGYAFLDFSTHMDAVTACCKLQKNAIFLGTEYRADIAFSRHVDQADDEIMAQVKSVFVDGLPSTWDEAHVFLHFKKFGEIEHVQLARNMFNAKRKDFGFVTFKTREAALKCIENINEDGVYEGTFKIPMKATLKRPQKKRLAPVVGTRRGYTHSDHPNTGLKHSYRVAHAYTSRPVSEPEFISRERSERIRERSPCSSRQIGYRHVMPQPPERYESISRRQVVRELPDIVDPRTRPGDGYIVGRLSNRLALDRHHATPLSYAQPQRLYSEDDDGDDGIYEVEYVYYDDRAMNTYDYPTYTGQAHRYSEMDDDLLASSSMLRRGSSRSESEVVAYPRRVVSRHDKIRIPPDEHIVYDRAGVEYGSRSYGTRYVSTRGASRGTSRPYH